jgi:hypothetical protein
MWRRLGLTCSYRHQSKLWRKKLTKHLIKYFNRKYGVTFLTISVLSNKFSTLIPLAFGRLPYADDRNYRQHLQLIYLWWSPDDRRSVCLIYSRPYPWITQQCKDPSEAEVEVQSHTFISFCRLGITHSVFVIVIDGVRRDESLTVSLYPSGCEEDEVNIEGYICACTAVPIQVHWIGKISFQHDWTPWNCVLLAVDEMRHTVKWRT